MQRSIFDLRARIKFLLKCASFSGIVIAVVATLACGVTPSPPYPPSSVIAEFTWDESTLRHFAPGSDNWPMTWSDDNNIYTSWGDGGGFGGSNQDGRVSLGVARIVGAWNNYEGVNVWGGKAAENSAQFSGKSYGMLSVNGDLYMAYFSQEGIDPYKAGGFAISRDKGKTFERSFEFKEPDQAFAVCTFLNFGKDYAGARDEFVYVYAGQPLDGCINRCIGNDVFLARVPQNQILERDAYQFLTGVSKNNKPIWSSDIENRKPVFSDPNGASVRFGVIYNPGIKRYLLSIAHNNKGGLGIFDAPEPWGPWTTVAYLENWFLGYTPSYHIAPQKWISADGKEITLVWSSKDRLNTMRGFLKLHEEQ